MTHQKFISTVIEHYRTSNKALSDLGEVFIVWSCKTANNSKVILADSETNSLCEATLIGSKKLIVYDFYKKILHEEYNLIGPFKD